MASVNKFLLIVSIAISLTGCTKNKISSTEKNSSKSINSDTTLYNLEFVTDGTTDKKSTFFISNIIAVEEKMFSRDSITVAIEYLKSKIRKH